MSEEEVKRESAQYPEKLSEGNDGQPRFGRLLLVLAAGVGIVVALTFGSLAWYT